MVGLSITAEATVGNVHQQMWAKSGLLVKCSPPAPLFPQEIPAKGTASTSKLEAIFLGLFNFFSSQDTAKWKKDLIEARNNFNRV